MDSRVEKIKKVLFKRYKFKYFKRGFTLVELLAVIVILAIIMLLAIPAVLSTLTTAKRKSFVEYVDKIFLTTQKQVMEEDINGNPIVGCKTFYIKSDLGLSNTGDYDGFVLVKNDGFNEMSYYITMHDDEYKIEAYLYDGSLDINNIEKWSKNDELSDSKACLAAGCSSCSAYEELTGEDACPTLPVVNDSTPNGFSGNGTESDPYLIESIDDLVYLSEKTNDGTLTGNKYYKLVNDLSFDCDKSYVNKSLKSSLTSGTGFTSIGVGNSFKSSFDGNNKKIYGLYSTVGGLFGSVKLDNNKYVVKDLSLLDADVTAGSESGIAVGYANLYDKVGSYIENITTSGKISCSSYCGGVIGEVYSSGKETYIKNLVNRASVKGTGSNVGGVFGKLESTSATNLTNFGEINISGGTSGGVGGQIYYSGSGSNVFDGEFKNFTNNGKVNSSGYYSGGVIGTLDRCDAYNFINNGEFIANNGYYAGGIAGSVYNYGTLYNSINKKSISGTANRMAGIAGYLSGNGKVFNSINEGNITNTSDDSSGVDIGGIVASIGSGYVANCGNKGNITANVVCNMGGIVGYSGNVRNSYNYGDLINKQTVAKDYKKIGGLVGTGTAKNSYTTGNIIIDTTNDSSTNDPIAFLSGDPGGGTWENVYGIGSITDKNSFGNNGDRYSPLLGFNYSSKNIYTKVKITNLKYIHLMTSTGSNIYSDIYTDATSLNSYVDLSTKDASIHYNFNNSPNKASFGLTDEYDFSQVNGTWFRDTLKFDNNWKFENGMYPKVYKILPNGSVTTELVAGQKDIPIN